MRFDFASGRRPDTRLTAASAVEDMAFRAACLAMFRTGLDTAEIARRMHEREGAVAAALRIAREAAR